jgi:hypothetical protein
MFSLGQRVQPATMIGSKQIEFFDHTPIDERDAIVELSDMPKPRGGAPMPFILADEGILLLSYFVPSEVSSDAGHKPTAAILRFDLPLMHLFGRQTTKQSEAIRCGVAVWNATAPIESISRRYCGGWRP